MTDTFEDDAHETEQSEGVTASEEAAAEPTLASSSLTKALSVARDRLLDRSLRNKLISTPLTSTKARQVRVFGESSDQVFTLLHTGKAMSFSPSTVAAESAEEGGDDAPAIWTPEAGDSDPASRSERQSDTKLQTRLTSEGLQKRLLSLFYEGQTLEEEQGINVLFLAVGFLEWREARQSEIARFAPLVLLPVELQRDGAKDRFKLRLRDEDLITNVSLQAWLKDQFGIELPDLPETDGWKPSDYLDSVARAVGERPGWKVHRDEITLGFFSFAKFLLWRDLDPQNWPQPEALTDHPLLKAVLLRGEEDEALVDVPLIGPEDRIDDVFPPAKLIHVTDADSSQAIAIQEALSGKNLVIQGPPGTGKSQTITNIIAGAVHAGKRVLFIAEKMAALEVVHDRLVQQKLGVVCLELHSRKSSKAQVLDQIKEGRNAPSPPNWSDRALRELTEAQTQLRGYSDRLHASHGGLSAFELMGRISLLKAQGAPAPRFAFPRAVGWSEDDLKAARIRAERLAGLLKASGVPAEHPWRGMGGPAPDMLEQERLRPRLVKLEGQTDKLNDAVASASDILVHPGSPTMGELEFWSKALELIASRPAGVDDQLSSPDFHDAVSDLRSAIEAGERLAALRAKLELQFRREAWTVDWAPVRRAISGHGKSLFRMLSGQYRDAIAQLRGAWVDPFPKKHETRLQALDDMLDARHLIEILDVSAARLAPVLGKHWRGEQSDWPLLRQAADWVEVAGALPAGLEVRRPECLVPVEVAKAAADRLRQGASVATVALGTISDDLKLNLEACLDGPSSFDGARVDAVASLVRRWNEAFDRVDQWPAVRDDLAWLGSLGCEALAAQIHDGDIAPEHVPSVLMLAAYEAMWGELRSKAGELESVRGDELDQTVGRFRKADVDRIRLASDQVARAHIDGRPTGSAGAVGILVDEMKKSRNLKPVRRLMVEAGEAIQRFKPVFLMSPLSVAQYLTPGLVEFDMLVIDEASQVRPEDALGAIARCRQLVVVGDDRQLPPTSFFSRMINDEPDIDEEEAGEGAKRIASVKDVESILNLCSRFPERMLRWHYRSEHPALIATSNRNFYKGELMLPPSVIAKASDGTTGLMFRQTVSGHYERGRTARNEKEADDVAHAVLEHAQTCPELSLGIGTFSVAQRDCIRDRLDDLARRNPHLEEFMKGKAGREPVFVKNLENIQGDERDVIYISVGYGRDANGKLTQNFGPVGRDGGERRLNVLITRARKRCEVFSSLVAEDISLEGAGKPGVRALKEFLKLAKDGYSAFAETTGRGFDSDFEEAVALAIQGLGYDCRPQVGMAGFFIDLAVLDPQDPDRYLLGVECDGAAYHSSRYARDRDRLRQAILERRGWSLHRIWSTDWFYRREREVEKLRLAIERAIAGQPQPAPYAPHAPEPDLVDLAGGVSEQGPDFEHDDDAPQVRPVKPYVFADFKVRSQPVKPQDLNLADLARATTRIVEVEQPIHTEEVGRRLAVCCGWQKAGSTIQDSAYRGLLQAEDWGKLVRQGDFWYLNDDQDVVPRDRSALPAAASVRRADMICPIEYSAAAVHALEENIALAPDALVVQTARVLGFARVGSDISEAVRQAIRDELGGLLVTDHLGRLRLAE